MPRGQSWYEIKNAADGAAEVYLFDEIGFWGIPASEFVKDLKAIKASQIELFINSPGGEVFDGMAIYNALQRHPANVHVTVDGLAASSASFIACVGDRITMAKGATMMIHEPYGMTIGTAADMDKTSELLSKIGDNIAAIYADRAGGTEAEWRARMRDETWYRAQEAVDAGLADEALAAPAKASALLAGRVFNLSKFKHVPEWVPQDKKAVRDAGRTMSQANLDKLHAGMKGIHDAHDGVCDMGAECPAQPSPANRGGRVRDDSVSLDQCIVPECDDAGALAVPICKDHMPLVLALPGEPDDAIGFPYARRPRNADWDTAYINNLPDSAFAVIKPGGKRDDEGKTVPRSLRELPHHDSGGGVDLPHLRNALARLDQADLTGAERTEAQKHLDAHAKAEGVGEEKQDLRWAIVTGLSRAGEKVLA